MSLEQEKQDKPPKESEAKLAKTIPSDPVTTTASPSQLIGVTLEEIESNNPLPSSANPGPGLNKLLPLLRQLLRSQAIMTATVLLVLVAVFSLLFPGQFPTLFNLEHIVIDYSGIVILGVGVTYAMTSGQFDLSVGAALALSGVLAVKAMTIVGGSGLFAVLLGLATALVTGLVIGLFNGWLITKARVPSIIVTLGSLSVAQGLAYTITGGRDLADVPQGLVDVLGFGRLFGIIPFPALVSILVVAVGAIFLAMTRFGLYTAAIGSNIEATRRAGINVDWVIIRVYLISGGLAGLAGFMSIARFGTTSVGGHTQDNLTALLGVVLGGTSLFGGRGTVLGTTVGVFIPAVLANGLILMNIFPYWQLVAVGLVLIGVVYIDLVKRRNRDK